jgi:hypothetical protein
MKIYLLTSILGWGPLGSVTLGLLGSGSIIICYGSVIRFRMRVLPLFQHFYAIKVVLGRIMYAYFWIPIYIKQNLRIRDTDVNVHRYTVMLPAD